MIRQCLDHLLGDQNMITMIIMRKNHGKEIMTITLVLYPRSMGITTLVMKFLQSILKRRNHKEALLQNGVIHLKRTRQEVLKEQNTISLKRDAEVARVTPQIRHLGIVQCHQEINIQSLKTVVNLLHTEGVTPVLFQQGLQNSDIQTFNTEVVPMIAQGHHHNRDV